MYMRSRVHRKHDSKTVDSLNKMSNPSIKERSYIITINGFENIFLINA